MPSGSEANGADPARENRELAAGALEYLPGGKFIALMVKQRRWGWLIGLALAVWFLFLYPLLLPIISAGLINRGVLMSAHKPYAEAVRQAFRADEFAGQLTRDINQRMDYFQVIEFSGDAGKLREYTLSVVPNQRLRYRIEKATLTSQSESCRVPKHLADEGAKLFTLEIEDQDVASIDNPPKGKTVSLTAAQWERIAPRVEDGRLNFKVRPVEALAALDCVGVNAQVRIAFEIYKDLVVAKKGDEPGTVQ